MASSFAGLDAHGGASSLLEAHLAHFMQSSSADADHPSPNDLSAAAILATLADNRPPTSHGFEEGELQDEDDDDEEDGDDNDSEQGGILLAHEGQSVVMAAPHYMTTAEQADFADISEAFHTSANYLYYETDPSPYDALDQHATVLESLSMEPLHAISSAALASTPDNQHELDFEVGMHDELIIVQNKYIFMDISSFFHRLAPRQLPISDLDSIQLPNTITRDDLQGDRYDFQGIDWHSRHLTRAEVRKEREIFESARIQPKLRHIRSVRSPASEICSLYC